MKDLLSICMMVKDGGKLFAQALESIQGFDAQVCVLIDNATTDDTVETARAFGAEIAYHDWPDDFAKARNLSMEPATGKWVLVLDHDERFEPTDIERMIEILKAEEEYAAIRITTLNETPGGMTAQFIPRFFRNGMIQYSGIKHHELTVDGAIRFVAARLYHSGYNLSAQKMKGKRERDIELLTRQIEAEPHKTYYRRNLIRTLRGEGQTDRLLVEATELDRLVQTYHLPISALSMQLVMVDVGWAYTTHGRFVEAEIVFAQMTREFPHNPDGSYYLGSCLLSQEKYAEAAEALGTYVSVLYALRTSANPPNVIVETWAAISRAYTKMAEAYLETNQWAKYQQAVNASMMNQMQDFASSFSARLVKKLAEKDAEIAALKAPESKLILA